MWMLHKQENLPLEPQLDLEAQICNLKIVDRYKRIWSASLSEIMSSMFSERSCLKKQGKGNRGKHVILSTFDHQVCLHIHEPTTHMHTTYTQEPLKELNVRDIVLTMIPNGF